jgi:ribonuclease HI
VYYGEGNPRNIACAVNGKQTSQRGELTAFLRCIESDSRELVVRTDSRYVQLGVTKWMQEWKKTAWYSKALQARYIDNADLWRAIDATLTKRENGVRVEWVKAHALPRHIRGGLTTELDIWENNGADLAAGRAAAAA